MSFIIEALIGNQLTALFLGSLLFGEIVIVAAAFLSGQGFWPFSIIYLVSFLGTMISDLVWFSLGKQVGKKDLWKKYEERNRKILVKIENRFGEEPLYVLLFYKFLFGTRIVTIVYLSLRKLEFKKFLFFDILGTFFWLLIVTGVGYLAGKGSSEIIPYFGKVEYVFTAIVLIVVISRTSSIWLNKKIPSH